MPKRVRSDSAVEEQAVTAYVDSCVQYKANVRFTTMADAKKPGHPVAPYVAIVGTAAQLQHASVHEIPVYSPVVAEAIRRAVSAAAHSDDGNACTTIIAKTNDGASAYTSVTIAVITEQASRTNCPHRPDCVTEAIRPAAAAAAAATDSANSHTRTPMDIYVRAPAGTESMMAAAIAKASPHSYTAVKGACGSAYCQQKVEMNIIFAHDQHPHVTVAELEGLCTSVQICQRLLDTPTNMLDTVVYAEIAATYGSSVLEHVKVNDIAGEALRERGYGGIWSVGKGAQYLPHLTTLHFENPAASKDAKNIALVGKGIVYDCGGLALKQKMDGAKGDCGGSSALFGAFIAVVRGAKANPGAYAHIRNLSVTLCLAENAIGPKAYRNDDIVIMKSGKAVEVKNTDAEGRVVLGDGVYYAANEQSFTPEVVIDAATLTGAQFITCGRHHAGIYANTATAEAAILAAGVSSGDTCFPLLYAPEYHAKQYVTPCADFRNVMHTTECGSSCGGWFVEQNLGSTFKGGYVHVDLASPAGSPVGGSGYGVALVVEYVKNFK